MGKIITIPKELIKKGELVIIPRKEYEAILRVLRKKARTQLNKDLKEALKEVKRGKLIGPFENVKDLIKSLNSKK